MNKKQIEHQIEALQQKLHDLDVDLKLLKSIDDFSDEEIRAAFVALHEQAMAYVNYVIEHGYDQKDAECYILEFVISKCLGKHAWNIINSHLE